MIVRYLLIAFNALNALSAVASVVMGGDWGDAVGAVVPIMTIAAILVTGSNAFRILVTIFRILVIVLNVLAVGVSLVSAVIFTDWSMLSLVFDAVTVALPTLNVIYLVRIVGEAKKKNEGTGPI